MSSAFESSDGGAARPTADPAIERAVDLRPDLEAVLRAELRAGEEIVWARTPRMGRDLSRFGRIGPFDTLAVVAVVAMAAAVAGLVAWTIDAIRGTDGPFSGWFGAFWWGSWIWLSTIDFLRDRLDRRRHDGWIHAVTTARVLSIETSPALRVQAWHPDEFAEVSWRPVPARHGPPVGNVRFLKGVTSHEGNAFMRVTAPEACAAALRALREPPAAVVSSA
ncbi:MAG: hypothetical protein ACO31E_09255 [Phycisphaerales bacterium]